MEQKESVIKPTRGRPPKNTVLEKVLSNEEPDQKPEVRPTTLNPPLTAEEQAIVGRVMAESDDWQTIGESSAVDFSLSRDVFELPAPAKKLQDEKQFFFRWITRTPARLDEMRNKSYPWKYWVVNSTQPIGGLFKPFIDATLGCICREDQMLVFKPWSHFMKEREIKQRFADSRTGLEDRDGETRKAGRDSDVEIKAGKRKGTSSETLRQEIKGTDIQYRGEEEVDRDMGRSTPIITESDLDVTE